jgi:hypothetical protein
VTGLGKWRVDGLGNQLGSIERLRKKSLKKCFLHLPELLKKESIRKEQKRMTQKDFWIQLESLRKERIRKTFGPNRNYSERKDSERRFAPSGKTQIGKTQKVVAWAGP